ncbi:MAG: SMI1/KNR4 family protein [Planctomycetaceae bacterium]
MPFSLDIGYVRRTEAKLGRQLPPNYVVLMCRSNGGGFEAHGDDWTLHPIFDDSDRQRLRRTCNDIVRETDAARQWPNFPPNALSIGSNGSGDHLLLLADPSSDHYDAVVYIWDHETGELLRAANDISDLSTDE